MKKFKPNVPLTVGLLLFTFTQIITRLISVPDIPCYALMLVAVSFEIWGILLATRSPEFKNSKLRQWKLRLIGKEPK